MSAAMGRPVRCRANQSATAMASRLGCRPVLVIQTAYHCHSAMATHLATH